MILEVRCRPARPDEAGTVASVIRQAFARQAEILGLNERDHPLYVAFETPVRVHERRSAGDSILVALSGDEIVGTISWSTASPAPEVKRLAVLPGHRGRGYGEALMRIAETALAESGAPRVELAIVAQFERLQRYYERLGYTARRRGSVPGLPCELLWMDKDLATPRA